MAGALGRPAWLAAACTASPGSTGVAGAGTSGEPGVRGTAPQSTSASPILTEARIVGVVSSTGDSFPVASVPADPWDPAGAAI